MDYTELFHSLHPGFFDRESIRALPLNDVSAEQVLYLDRFVPEKTCFPFPGGIRFDIYDGDTQKLVQAVGQVEEGWKQYYEEPGEHPVFCAFDGDKVASFCTLHDMGLHLGLHVGGPGCVGTVPGYRRRGIGLEMVRRATEYFQKNGFDLAYIHYTHVDKWYEKLGYETVLKWNSGGIVWVKPET